jgi:predicted small lipoprotein YifL
MEKRIHIISFLLVLLLSLIACGGSGPEEIPAEEIITRSAQRMKETTGFRFVIERDGAPAYVDPPQNILSFRRATGAYVAPDRALAVVRVIGPGLITDVDVVTVAEIQYQTNPLTDQWEELPPDWGFNPTVLFDDELGLQRVLTDDLTNLQQIEPENLAEADGPDALLYTLTADVAGDRIYRVSGGLIGPQAVSIKLWIMPETFELVRLQVTEPEPDTEEGESIWQVDFSRYEELIEIEPPVLENDETS